MSANFTKIKTLGVQTLQNYLRLGAAEAPKYINKVREDVIYKKANELNTWYTRILGLDEVKLYQDRVVKLQENLLGVQDRRRSISQQLTEIRKNLTDLQDQIHKVKRNDDLQGFLNLMRDETEILKTERDVNAKYLECDREEREVFTAFTNAVRDSHEKQRAQLEYTKYFGLILSILGSFLAFCYSSLRKQDLKNFIVDNLEVSSHTPQPLIQQLDNKETNIILKRIETNYTTIIEALNKSGIINLNKDEFVVHSPKDELVLHGPKDDNILSDVFKHKKDVLMYGCGAALGFFILRNLFT